PFPKHFLRERHAFFAASGLRETEELANGKVAGMCCDEIEKAGFVLGVTKAAQILDAGFRYVHASQSQNGGHNFAVIANASQAGCVFGSSVDLKASASFFCEMAGVVVARGEFQIHAGDFHFLVGVLDAKIGQTYLAMDHGKLHLAGESFLEALGSPLAFPPSLSELAVQVLF